MEQITKKVITFHNYPLTLQNASYDKISKKLKIKSLKVHNKNVIGKIQMDIYVSKFGATKFIKLHQTSGQALTHFVMKQEAQNLWLKRIIKEPK